VIDRKLLRLSATSKKVDELIRQDRRITVREIVAQLGVGHQAAQEIMEIFGISESLTLQTTQKNGRELHSYPTYRPDLAPSDYQLFGSLKDHLRGHHYENDETVQEAVRSWLLRAGTDFYR
jgi:hypothetical protein